MNIILLLYKKIFLEEFLILEGKSKFDLSKFRLDTDLNQILVVGICLHLKYIEEDEKAMKNFLAKLNFSYEEEKILEEKILEFRCEFTDEEINSLKELNELLKTKDKQEDISNEVFSKNTLKKKTNEITETILETAKVSSDAINTTIKSIINGIDNESSGTKLRLIELLSKSNSDTFLTINRLQDKQISDEMRNRSDKPSVIVNNNTTNDSRSINFENQNQRKLADQSTAMKDLGSILEAVKLLPGDVINKDNED